MLSLARARPSSRHFGSRQYEHWGSMTDSSYNQVERSSVVPPGGSKALRSFQQEERARSPGPGAYRPERTANAMTALQKRPSTRGTMSISKRPMLTPTPDDGVPPPGSYERADEGTFQKVEAFVEPGRSLSPEAAALASVHRRRVAAEALISKHPTAVPSFSKRVQRKQEAEKLGTMRKKEMALRAKVRKQKQDRRKLDSRAKSAPFLSMEKRWFDPSKTPEPQRSPGPGGYTMPKWYRKFGADAVARTPSQSRGPQRLPPDRMMVYEGYQTVLRDTPDLGPGEYMPDVLMSATDGVPRTKTDLSRSPKGFASVLSASPVTFGASVRADAKDANSILGFAPVSKRALRRPQPLRPGTTGSLQGEGTLASSLAESRRAATPSLRREPVHLAFPAPTHLASTESRIGDTVRPITSVSSLSRTFAMESPSAAGIAELFGSSRLDSASGLLLPSGSKKQREGPKMSPMRAHLRDQARKAAEMRNESTRREDVSSIEKLDDWLEGRKAKFSEMRAEKDEEPAAEEPADAEGFAKAQAEVEVPTEPQLSS